MTKKSKDQPEPADLTATSSTNDSDVVFPVVSCSLLKQQVAQQLSDSHLSLIGEESLDEVALYYILRVDPKQSIITVNTRAPVLISVKSLRGYQVILDRDDLRVDEPLANLMPSPVEK
jgi:flagellar assembly factor FliW